MAQQRAKSAPLQRHHIRFRDPRAGVHLTAAHHVRNQAGNVKVMRADEAAVTHVDQLAGDGGQAAAARHRKQALVRRAVARVEHGARLVQSHEQQLVLVRHDDVAGQQVTKAAAVQRAGAHRGHRGSSEAFGQKRQDVLVGGGCGVFSRAARNVGQAARTRHQAHTNFHQPEVAFHRRHALGGIHRQFAAAAQRQAANGRHHRHRCVTQLEHHSLQFSLHAVQRVHAAGHERRQHGLQVCTGREHLVVRPDHHAFVAFLGQVHAARQAFGHVRADGVHLGFDAGNQHVAIRTVQRPQADRVVFMQRGACRGERLGLRAQHVFREVLARIHRQAAAGNEFLRCGAPRALGRVNATRLGHRPVEHPVGQRRG